MSTTPDNDSPVVDRHLNCSSYQWCIDDNFLDNIINTRNTTSKGTPGRNTEPETFYVLVSYSTSLDTESCITRRHDVATMKSNLTTLREVAETIMTHFGLPFNGWKLIRVFWNQNEDVEKLDERGNFTKLHNTNFDNVFKGLKHMMFGQVSVDVVLQDGVAYCSCGRLY